MTPERAMHLLTTTGAVRRGHFVGTSGKHLDTYVAKDRATRFPSVVSEFCFDLAKLFVKADIDAVVAPAVGGIALSQWTAHHLSVMRPDRPEVLALYSEQDEETLFDASDEPLAITMPALEPKKGSPHLILGLGQKLIHRKGTFILKRGFNEDVRGKRVLEVEDILSTGGSARKTAEAIIEAGGILVGLGVLANGGNVSPEACGVKWLEALTQIDRQIFTETECADHGLCAKGVPVNTDFGHGKAFLARKG